MGKKYDAYAKAAQAETAARVRLEAEKVGQDQQAIQQASTDLKQANAIANTLFGEMLDDPQG